MDKQRLQVKLDQHLDDLRTSLLEESYEGDLASYFDTVHHRLLLRCVRRRVQDRRFVDLLYRFLKAGHIDRGLFTASSEGVPQGGVLSPLLSNIMLYEFDMLLEAKYLNK
nr:reverse transcriptase domain-containing protein [Agrobacterium sp. S2/73]